MMSLRRTEHLSSVLLHTELKALASATQPQNKYKINTGKEWKVSLYANDMIAMCAIQSIDT